MPKLTKHPKLRTHVRKGAGGKVWVSYWYDMRGTGERDISLGSDLATALLRWDEIHNRGPRIAGTILQAIERWERECLPEYTNATTRRNYAQNLTKIKPVFGPATWESVTAQTIAAYLAKRSAKVQANREMALLSVIWGKARLWGLTALAYPAWGMRYKNKERPARVEVTDEAFAAVYAHADELLRDAMDIASATGLRVRDTLALRLSDIRGGRLVVEASKTGKLVEFELEASGVLPALIERRKANRKAEHLFLLAHGRRQVTERMLRDRFKAAREAAISQLQDKGQQDLADQVQLLHMRTMRKRAAQLAGSLAEAQALLQHSSAATTQRHYRIGDRIKPVR